VVARGPGGGGGGRAPPPRGRVEASSDGPGHGSTFKVTLPTAATRAAEAGIGHAEVPSTANSSYRVLVVDDNVDSAQMMGTLLELHGHAVRIAHNAEGALALTRDFTPDAAVLDIGLPGIDGYQLAARLRAEARSRNLRLIALTGWGQDADRLRAEQAGFDVHLTKPAGASAVLQALHKKC
jgi:CheY-like chemotaxis protein